MKKQTAGRDNLGKLAPEFARYNDDVLFGEVWSREDKLSLRDRSMITIAALMGTKNFPQVKAHLQMGKAHGVTKEEAVEIVTQLAFYTGWANAWTVFPMIAEVYSEDEEESNNFSPMFGIGQPNDAYAKYFIGQSYLNPLTKAGEPTIGIANVTFEPKCRNNWHKHNATKGGGQILICTDGEGWYQEEGKAPVSLVPGTVITIPANTKHWHGAKANSWFSHIAFDVPGENTSNEWLEPVTDEEYDKLGE